MIGFKEYISEEIVPAVINSIENYKRRKLSGYYNINSTDKTKDLPNGKRATQIKFNYIKSREQASSNYHVDHIKRALLNKGLVPTNIEHHPDGISMHVYRA